MKRSQPPRSNRLLAPLFGVMAVLLGGAGHAAPPFPDYPLQTGTGSIPPNILFIMDDSGSMGSTYMGAAGDLILQELEDSPSHRSYVNNVLYYNPEIEYKPWMNWDGNRLTGGVTYNSAYSHFDLAEDPINLADSSSCKPSISNGANTWVCGGDQTFWVPKPGVANPGTDYRNFYRFRIRSNNLSFERCEYDRLGNKGSCVNERPTARTAEAERNNFAIWFSYHRTRMKAAKAGASEAFGQLGVNFRVGYDSIWRLNKGQRSEKGGSGPVFPIPVGTDAGRFDESNRREWYEWLHGARNYGTTPLRNTLVRAGEYYEGNFSSLPNPWGPGDADQQLSCRQSYAILTTDGYWNGGSPGVGNADNSTGVTVQRPDGTSRNTYPVAVDPFKDNHSNTLADVAMYYWKRDLQPDLANNVPSSARNPAFWQHMSTFGISIGLGGTVDQTSVAEVMALGGVTINGSATGWPSPHSGSAARRIDDLLHAAVNGRGEFVAASNPQEFADAVRRSLAAIAAVQASGSNVASNGPSLNNGSQLFQATYTSGEWSGDVKAFSIAGGAIAADPVWSMTAQALADPDGFADRPVFTTNSSNNGANFPTSDQRDALARPKAPGSAETLSGTLNANYIKGDRTGEGSGPLALRTRTSPVGDIVNSSPFYVQENESLFIGANDGMLHGIDALTGETLFSYVPRGLDFSKLAMLSSQDYQHHFFVDGGIDVTSRDQGNGKNILVASLGRGGKGVFGLNVTEPSTSSTSMVMWDHTFQTGGSADMGYVLGAPLVRKGNNGTPVAFVGNGIGSVNGSATLFIYNAETGALLKSIKAEAGPNNGLAEVRAADVDGDGTADYVYAGDLKGNVWKFDVTGSNTNQWDVAYKQGNTNKALFVATDPSGAAQPITGAVALAMEPVTRKIFVLFGTGSYITNGDLTNTQVQSLYAVIDEGTSANFPVTKGELHKREIPLTGTDSQGRAARSWESYSELPANKRGWYVNLGVPSPAADGERVVTAPFVRGRALWFSSIIPSPGDGCEAGGTGYLNAVDVFTGTNPVASGGGTYSFIDVDGDGTGNDKLTGQDPGTESGFITSVDLGIGMPSQGLSVGNQIYACGSDAECGWVATPPGGSGPARLQWRELVDTE